MVEMTQDSQGCRPMLRAGAVHEPGQLIHSVADVGPETGGEMCERADESSVRFSREFVTRWRRDKFVGAARRVVGTELVTRALVGKFTNLRGGAHEENFL